MNAWAASGIALGVLSFLASLALTARPRARAVVLLGMLIGLALVLCGVLWSPEDAPALPGGAAFFLSLLVFRVLATFERAAIATPPR